METTDEQEIQDKMVKMRLRSFVALVFSIIVGTNSFTLIYQKVLNNEQQQIYNKERADRISERMLEEAKQHTMIVNLQRDLDECQSNNK